MRKAIESKPSWRERVPGSAGIALIFAGLFLLGLSRMSVIGRLSPGIAISSGLGGVLILSTGMFLRYSRGRRR